MHRWSWTETALLGMIVIWGVNFAVAKRALGAFDPLAFNALRFALASGFVWCVLRARGPLASPARADVPRLLLLGVLGNSVYQMAFILGLSRTRAGDASLILAVSPACTALLSRATGHERPGPRTWGGAALALLGVALVTGSATARSSAGLARTAIVGDVILLAAAILWALYTVGARPLVRRYGSVPVTAWTLWAGTPVLLAAGAPALARTRWAAIDAPAWGGLLFSALLSIGLAYLIWYRGVERLGNTRTAIFSNLTPVVALLASALYLGERPGPLALLGALCTLAGVMWVRTDAGTPPAPSLAVADPTKH